MKCCGGICQFKRIVTAKYFTVPNPPPLRISGSVILKYTPTVNMIPDMREFYDSTNGPNWSVQGGWPIGCPCEWRGVTCNPAQYITGIDLPNTGLSGTPSDSIANIWSLTSLSLPGNSLTGLPTVIGDLPITSLVRPAVTEKLVVLPDSITPHSYSFLFNRCSTTIKSHHCPRKLVCSL